MEKKFQRLKLRLTNTTCHLPPFGYVFCGIYLLFGYTRHSAFGTRHKCQCYKFIITHCIRGDNIKQQTNINNDVKRTRSMCPPCALRSSNNNKICVYSLLLSSKLNVDGADNTDFIYLVFGFSCRRTLLFHRWYKSLILNLNLNTE